MSLAPRSSMVYSGELPVMAAVFVDAGERLRDTSAHDEQRSYAYDNPGDRFATFLLTESVPLAAQHVKLTRNPAGRGIAGRSSGGIGAFTVAWQRPDQFRKVFSANGSFVNIRGGGAYGEGTLSGRHGAAIFPDALRWLWRDSDLGESRQSAKCRKLRLRST